MAKTTRFIFDESRDQLDKPIIGTLEASSSILCRTFKGLEGEASAKPISSRIRAIRGFVASSEYFLSNNLAALNDFSRLSAVDKLEH